jgi:hypothetical protein
MIKFKTSTTKRLNDVQASGWDDAIATAESEIALAQNRIADLQKSIRSFRRLRDKGMDFPLGRQNASTHNQRTTRVRVTLDVWLAFDDVADADAARKRVEDYLFSELNIDEIHSVGEIIEVEDE